MKKVFTFLIANVILVSVCSADLVDIIDKRSEYADKLKEVRESLFEDDIISVCCKATLGDIYRELSKKDTNFQQVTSDVFDVLPDVSDSDKVHLLNKIAVLCIFHLLKTGVYDFVGASFYPEEEDLLDIKIDGQSPTADDFCEIQETLQRNWEMKGSLPKTPAAFEDVVRAVVKKHQMLTEL